MIRGHIDNWGNALLEIQVQGARGSATLVGHLDTEFDGADLSLPIDVAVTLGLDLAYRMEFELATGEGTTQLVFTGIGSIGDEGEREVTIVLNDSDDVLISRAWLRGHSLYANYVTGELVIQPETTPQPRPRRRRRQ